MSRNAAPFEINLNDSTVSINYSTSLEPQVKVDKLASLGIKDAEEIGKKYNQIKEKIHEFESTVNTIVKQHHNQYIQTFDVFMNKVRDDFKRGTNEIKQSEKMKRKQEDIALILTERDFFKNESIRLNQYCKELSAGIESLGHDYNTQLSEIKILQEKWKKSEMVNKKLLLELEENVHLIKNLEEKLKEATISQNINATLATNNDISKDRIKVSTGGLPTVETEKDLIITESNENINIEAWLNSKDRLVVDNKMLDVLKGEFIKYREKLKSDLKAERAKTASISKELNKFKQSRSEAEKVFQECVEETKKEIFARKAKATITYGNKNQYSVSSLLKGTKSIKAENPLDEINIENFKSGDKVKLIETFLSNNEIINMIFDNIFRKQLRTISDNLDFKERMQSTKYTFKDKKLQTFYSKSNFLTKNNNHSEPYLV